MNIQPGWMLARSVWNLPQGDIELWTYSPGDDIQDLFEEAFLSDTRISTGAYLAASPADVLNAVSQNPFRYWLPASSLVAGIICSRNNDYRSIHIHPDTPCACHYHIPTSRRPECLAGLP